MGTFMIEAVQTGYPFAAGVCECGAPIPAIMADRYTANHKCPRCGKETPVDVNAQGGLTISLG